MLRSTGQRYATFGREHDGCLLAIIDVNYLMPQLRRVSINPADLPLWKGQLALILWRPRL